MVAELTKELEMMKAKLMSMEEKATKDASEVDALKDLVEENQAKANAMKQDMINKLQEFEAAKIEIIDVLGPKFAEIKGQADGTINDAKRKFEETDETIRNIVKTAGDKFIKLEEVLKQAEANSTNTQTTIIAICKHPNEKQQSTRTLLFSFDQHCRQ